MKRWTARVAILACFGCSGVAAWAIAASRPAEPETGDLRLAVEAFMVDVRDAKGRVPEAVAPRDLAVSEDDESRAVVAVEQPGEPGFEPWRVTVLFDLTTSGEGSMARSARLLEERAQTLTDLGWVEVVVADPEPRLIMPATRDALDLAGALGRVSLLERGADRLVEQRREALGLLERVTGAERQQVIAEAVREEVSLVEDRQRAWLGWLSAGRPRGPQAVVLVTDGFDLSPEAALRRLAGEEVPAGTGESLSVDALGKALTAYRWVVFPLALRGSRVEEPSRFGVVENPDNPSVPVLGTFRIPGRKSPAERAGLAEAPAPVPQRPEEALERLAFLSGGEAVMEADQLDGALEGLAGRWRVRYSSAREPASTGSSLAVTSTREGWSVRAPQWSGGATPEAVAALRAERLLLGEEVPGDLEVVAVIETDGAVPRLEARVAVGSGVDPAARVTLVAVGEAGRQVSHRRAVPSRLEDPSQVRLSLPLDLETTGIDRVAVMVEDLVTGRWGGTLAGLVVRGEEADEAREAFFDVDLGLLPAPRPLHLLRPDGGYLRGPVSFETVVSDPTIERVDFLLDGRRVEQSESAPFRAVLNLGRLPLRRLVEAVAYDAAGALVARDEVTINAGGDQFAVRFTEPLDPDALGAVFDVAAEVEVPAGQRIERVEFFRDEEKVATLFRPPFRHRMAGGAATPGFVRVKARLESGTEVEDLLVLGPGTADRVEVNLVELYVVVSDRAGRPVRDLPQEVFEVREEGAPQELAGFNSAGDLPVTVGLAIDASASMFAKLPSVQEAARQFLGGLEDGRDRAFLVEFDSRPSLAAEPTGDLDRVVTAVDRLESGGQTSLWESIVFSLVQLQGAGGRKALVVYSDGADQDKGFDYRTCLRFARKVGIPVYVIVSNNEAVRTDGIGLRTFGDRLDRLTRSVGGKTYLVRSGQDLTEVYREIERELASQYLLTYYSGAGREGGWRGVEVEVKGRGLSARTVAGYER
ncbi:MAG: VWA domain-containing protein [Acidobacteriota bacterium]